MNKIKLLVITIITCLAMAFSLPIVNATQIQEIRKGTVQLLYVNTKGNSFDIKTRHRVGTETKLLDPENAKIVLESDSYSQKYSFNMDGNIASGYTTGNWDAKNDLDLGFGATDLQSEGYSNLSVQFNDVKGPGKISLFTLDDEGKNALPVLDRNEYYIKTGSKLQLPNNTNMYTKLLITKPGTYNVKAIVTAEKNGKEIKSKEVTLTFIAEKNSSTSEKPDSNENTEKPGVDEQNIQDEQPEIATDEVKLRKGHLDAFYLRSNSNSIELNMREDITGQGVIRKPESATMIMGSDWYTEDVEKYHLPKGEKGGYTTPGFGREMMYPGWASNDYSKYGYDSAYLEFTKVTGPGTVAIFKQNLDGTTSPLLKDKNYYIETGAKLNIHSNSHTHATWVFSKPGTYKMSVVAIAKKGREEIRSRETEYTWIAESDGKQDNNPTEKEEPNDTTNPQNSQTEQNENQNHTGNDHDSNKNEKTVLDKGHLDAFNVSYNSADGKLVLNTKEDITGTGILRNPEDLILKVKESAYKNMPESLHKILPHSGYFLTQAPTTDEEYDLLFPGWDTQGVKPKYNAININILEVTGPGRVFMFENGTFGSGILPVLTSKSYELKSGSTIFQPEAAHRHTNWLFEKPGVYTMKVQASVASSDRANTISSNIATYTWEIGDSSKNKQQSEEDHDKQNQHDNPQTSEKNIQNETDNKGNADIENNKTKIKSVLNDLGNAINPASVNLPKDAGNLKNTKNKLASTGTNNTTIIMLVIFTLAGVIGISVKRKIGLS